METYLCFRFAVDRNQELHHFRVEWQHCVQGSVNSNFFLLESETQLSNGFPLN